jgi:AraC-type transcriptional regulator N-terminus/Bacterial regulatory helix-turn-helix proteins, AraC family
MATTSKEQVREWGRELARKIAFFVGSKERLTTEVPGLLLSRRTAPTAPASAVYEPSLAVVAQGRKRADLAGTTFIFDESRYLLTSLDLPVVCNVIEASEEVPYLCFVLKLEMPAVRELLSREEIQAPEALADRPAMATGETTAELLAPCCRLVDLLNTPQDIPFLSGLIQREIIYRILRGPEGARLRAIATLGDQSHRTAKAVAWVRANYAKPLRVEDLAKIAGMGVSTLHHHFRALTSMSPLQYQKQFRLQAAGNACSWMVWTPPVLLLRSGTKAPANSIANTVASSANLPCGIFGLSVRQALRPWNRSVIGKTLAELVATKHDIPW